MPKSRLIIYVNGDLTDPTSVGTGDVGGDYGIRTADTLEEVTAVGEAYTKFSTGYYEYEFDQIEEDTVYDVATTIVYQSTTYNIAAQAQGELTTATVVLPNTTSHYTSQAEVLHYIGTHAETLLLEDSESKNNVWRQVLRHADETIKMYVMQHYNPTALLGNSWVRNAATLLVAHHLSGRRGSPHIYTSAADRVYEQLDMIRDNRFRIPDATVRYFQGPIVRNYQMQAWWQHPMRVENSKSTKVSNYPGEDLALEPFLYFGPLGN